MKKIRNMSLNNILRARNLKIKARNVILSSTLIRWSQQFSSRERADQSTLRFAEWKKTWTTVHPSRQRTVLEQLTFSRPVSSGLTNHGRDGYEITIALCSPLQALLSASLSASATPRAFRSKVKRFIDIKTQAEIWCTNYNIHDFLLPKWKK